MVQDGTARERTGMYRTGPAWRGQDRVGQEQSGQGMLGQDPLLFKAFLSALLAAPQPQRGCNFALAAPQPRVFFALQAAPQPPAG